MGCLGQNVAATNEQNEEDRKRLNDLVEQNKAELEEAIEFSKTNHFQGL